MSKILIAFAVASLSACTTNVVHPDPNANFDRDSYECDKDVAAVQDRIRMVTMHRACMRNKGWVEKGMW